MSNSLILTFQGYVDSILQKCDWKELRNVLSYVPWKVMAVYDDIDNKWDFFNTVLLDVLDTCLSSEGFL